MSKFNLKTGDILLFDYGGGGIMGCCSCLIKSLTRSNISHVCMVLKDPVFIHPYLKGYYVWESNWEGTLDPQDDKLKFGVQLTSLETILQNYRKKNSIVYVRRISCDPEMFCAKNLEAIHKVVYDKIYDINPIDWINAIERKDNEPQKTDRFWCSALVGYIYTKCGLLNKDTDWSILRPSDFSQKYNNQLEFLDNITLGKQTIL
tara:strand:- start:858 stop:1469 length:612 start_codon:yes stop_codon:yes gene_type:complete